MGAASGRKGIRQVETESQSNRGQNATIIKHNYKTAGNLANMHANRRPKNKTNAAAQLKANQQVTV